MATKTGTNVNFVKVNTQAQYDDLTKQDGTIYFVVSEKKIYLDSVGYGMSDEDAAQFLSIDGGTLNGDLIMGEGKDIIFVHPEGLKRRIERAPYGGKGIIIQVGYTTYNFETENLSISSGQEDAPVGIHGVADPVFDSSAANKAYVDQEISSILNMKGANNGLAELDADGVVPSSQLPSYVDDVIEAANQGSFPTTGESGKIYVALDNNKTYRWSGSVYVEISAGLALGETQATAYRGDRGKIAYDHAILIDNNPHNVTKSQIGLSIVQNYGIATQTQAEGGAENNLYMTPLRTKQAVEKLAPKLSWTVVS